MRTAAELTCKKKQKKILVVVIGNSFYKHVTTEVLQILCTKSRQCGSDLYGFGIQ